MNLIWQTITIVLVGTLLMRIGGRKSISQMTIAQTVVIISIGKVLIEPIAQKEMWINFYIAAIMVLVLLVMEFIMLKSKTFSILIGGKPVIVIKNGEPVIENMKKLRMTAGELAARLRQHGIENIGDLEFATLDQNGEIGYRWSKEKQPSTYQDIEKLHKRLEKLEQMIKVNDN